MAFVPATAGADEWALIALIAAVMTGLYVGSTREMANPGKPIAECHDGTIVGVFGRRVRRRPGRAPAQRAKLRAAHPGERGRTLTAQVSDELAPGELCGVRVRPAPDGEWIVEGLDAERQTTRIRWEFDSEAEAVRVLDLLNLEIVEPPVNEAGHPVPVSDAEFDAVQHAEQLAATGE